MIKPAITSPPSDPPKWIVGVGASGSAGLQDLRALLAAWPAGCPAALMAVLHRPVDSPSELARVLRSSSSIPIVVAHQGDAVFPGVCYLGEPDAHLTLDAFGRVDLTADSLYRNSTIDLLFNSLANNAPPHMAGVILSGSLDDGSDGLAAIAAAGGLTMAVSADGALGGQMPENAVRRCGSVDFRGEPADIAREVGRRTTVADIPA
jgi:chemotaxis response regulator CheB